MSATRSVGVVVVLQPSHHGGHQLLQLLGPLPARLQDFFVVGLLLAVVVHHRPVADERQGEATHPGVSGNYYLVDGAHPCSKDKDEVRRCTAKVSACYSNVSQCHWPLPTYHSDVEKRVDLH